jgi:DNA-binding IclR family transcriptional regulator
VFRPDDSLQSLDVGTLLPLHATALGKVLLAYDTTLVASPEAYTRRTLVTQTAIKRAGAKVREAGWAVENGEMISGEAGVAAPIRGHGGIVVGAIGVSGAVERLCEPDGSPNARLLGHVRDAARAVSRDLGASRG